METTIPSYLAAKPSRDLIIAAHQQITHQWWETAPERFDLFVSEAVINEIRQGDQVVAEKRLKIVESIPVQVFSEDVKYLIHAYRQRLGLAGSGITDLPYLAYAVAYEMTYLVTWNCRHIANGEVIKRLTLANHELGRHTPVIVTPEELLEDYPGDEL